MANQIVSNTGSFVPTTDIWDTQQLYDVELDSEEFRELLVRLYQNLNNMAIVINTKDSAYYSTQEFLNSQLFFANPSMDSNTANGIQLRQAFRTTIDFGALPNAGTKSVAHNIDISIIIPLTTFSFTRIYGAASKPDQTSFIPLPYSSATLINNIELSVTDTDIVITTSIDYSAYNGIIVVEYLKQ
jgi:hypothetical protein